MKKHESTSQRVIYNHACLTYYSAWRQPLSGKVSTMGVSSLNGSMRPGIRLRREGMGQRNLQCMEAAGESRRKAGGDEFKDLAA